MEALQAKIKEFVKTPVGKIAVVAIVFFVVLFVLGISLAAFFMLSTMRSTTTTEGPKATVKVQKTAETSTAEAGNETSTGGAAGESTDFKVYEYKDPFEPLVKATETSTPTSIGGTGSGGGETTTPAEDDDGTPSESPPSGPQVLEVQDIFTENGVKYASIKYGATVYKVKEGDRVDESPYEVLTIGSDSVILLYGDQRVEVSIGESIVK